MNRVKLVLAAGLGLVALFITSCKENSGSTGANVLPSNDLISAYQTDTTTVLTSMYLKDSTGSIITDDLLASGLGSINDPVFGTFKASIYAQIFSPPNSDSSQIPWKHRYIVDSAVFILPYITGSGTISYYGNLDAQTIVVDTLESVIHATSSSGNAVAYHNDTIIKHDAAHPIAVQQIIPPNPYYGHDTAVRIKIKNSWLNYITSKIANSPGYYSTFDSLVKGFYITVSDPLQLPGQGGILYIYLNQGSFACVDLYYHNPNDTTHTAYWLQYPIGGTYFTHIDRNTATAPFANKHPIGVHDSIEANDLIYVQAGAGAMGRINFPNLTNNWAIYKHVIINKAELDLTVDQEYSQNPFAPPANLVLLATDASGNPYTTADYTNFNLTQFPQGTYDAYNHIYRFIITQYVQKVIDSKNSRIIDRGLYLVAGNPASPERVVLYGAQHGAAIPTTQRAKLIMYYTPLKN